MSWFLAQLQLAGWLPARTVMMWSLNLPAKEVTENLLH